jgi:hypothetical protein
MLFFDKFLVLKSGDNVYLVNQNTDIETENFLNFNDWEAHVTADGINDRTIHIIKNGFHFPYGATMEFPIQNPKLAEVEFNPGPLDVTSGNFTLAKDWYPQTGKAVFKIDAQTDLEIKAGNNFIYKIEAGTHIETNDHIMFNNWSNINQVPGNTVLNITKGFHFSNDGREYPAANPEVAEVEFFGSQLELLSGNLTFAKDNYPQENHKVVHKIKAETDIELRSNNMLFPGVGVMYKVPAGTEIETNDHIFFLDWARITSLEILFYQFQMVFILISWEIILFQLLSLM